MNVIPSTIGSPVPVQVSRGGVRVVSLVEPPSQGMKDSSCFSPRKVGFLLGSQRDFSPLSEMSKGMKDSPFESRTSGSLDPSVKIPEVPSSSVILHLFKLIFS